MKVTGFGFILLAVLAIAFSETKEWFPLFAAYVGLGGVLLAAGLLFFSLDSQKES